MKKLVSLFFIFVFILSVQSLAITKTPTIIGGTGLVRMPTGDVLDNRDYSFGIDYGSEVSSSAPSKPLLSYNVNMGSVWGRKGFELGFSGRTDKATERIKEGVFINMKYSLSSDDDNDSLYLAIGLENLSSYNDTDAYMVASKYFKGGAGLHFGALFDLSGPKFRPVGMLGIGMPIGGMPLTLMGEVFAGETIFEANAGIRYTLYKQMSFLLRGINITNSSSSRSSQSVTAGISLVSPF